MSYNILRIVTLTCAIALGATINTANAGGHLNASGTFTGASNHITKGDVTITEASDGSVIVTLEGNFFFDGAPDPWVGFGKNGKFVKGTNFEKLKSNNGTQSYKVPASIDVGQFNEVYIWCERFSVPLGVAPLG